LASSSVESFASDSSTSSCSRRLRFIAAVSNGKVTIVDDETFIPPSLSSSHTTSSDDSNSNNNSNNPIDRLDSSESPRSIVNIHAAPLVERRTSSIG
jgi:hypothetical protein